MGGVVFAQSTATLSRYGQPMAVAAGGIIPEGMWIIGGGWTVTTIGSTPVTLTCAAGLCLSDGQNCTAVAATTIVSVGA